MKWDNDMTSELAPRQKDIPYYYDETPTWYKSSKNTVPNQVNLVEEFVVVLDPAQLAVSPPVFLEGPVRRGRHHEVHGLRAEIRPSSIPEYKIVPRWNARGGRFDEGHRGRVFRQPREVSRRIVQVSELFGDERFKLCVCGHIA